MFLFLLIFGSIRSTRSDASSSLKEYKTIVFIALEYRRYYTIVLYSLYSLYFFGLLWAFQECKDNKIFYNSTKISEKSDKVLYFLSFSYC